MNDKSIIVLVMLAASLGLYAHAEASEFYGSVSGPDFQVSFAGPSPYGYWAPYPVGFVFFSDVDWRGHHHHRSWHGHHDDHGRHGGRHGGGHRGRR